MKVFLFLIFIAPAVFALEKATLAAGCFWGVEEFYRKLDGVKETGVGYTGGSKKNPTYHDVSTGRSGHAEAVEIIFDEKKINYEKILELFFKLHDPTTVDRQGNDVGRQYRSAVFYHSNEQKIIAEKMVNRVTKSHVWKNKVVSEIVPASIFYEAEDEHQKYLLRNPKGYDNHFLRKISF